MTPSPQPGVLAEGSEAAISSRTRLTPGARDIIEGPDRIRVCLVGPSLDILGGQAVQLDRLLRRLRETPGIGVGFIAMNPRLPGPLRALQRVKYLRTVVTLMAYVASLLRHVWRYDVVQVFSPSYWAFLLGPVPAMAVGRLYGRRTLLNYHSGEADDHLAHWRSAVAIIRTADRIAVPSDYLREVFAKYDLPAEVIPNHVDVDAIPYRERVVLRPAFLSNRNLEPMYNVACSIRAFGRVQQAIPHATLTVAGFGSEGSRLEALAKDLGLSNVRFTGRVTPEQMGQLLDQADVLLNSPNIDNMPLSLIEAQAAGLPIVSTSAGGIPFIVRHDETGLLVPPGDDAAMSEAALRMLSEPGLAARLAASARSAYLANHTWEAVSPAWMRLYRDLGRPANGERVS